MKTCSKLIRSMNSHAMDINTLAEKSGVNKVFIKKYLSGESEPADEVLELLAAALKEDTADIKGDTKPAICDGRSIKIEYAASVMGISVNTLRYWLREDPNHYGEGFGSAKQGRCKYSYFINPIAFQKYIEAMKAVAQ